MGRFEPALPEEGRAKSRPHHTSLGRRSGQCYRHRAIVCAWNARPEPPKEFRFPILMRTKPSTMGLGKLLAMDAHDPRNRICRSWLVQCVC